MPAKTSWSTHVLQPQPCMSKRGEESWLWSCGCKPKATKAGRRTSTFDLPVADHQPCPRADAEASVPFVANVACADWQGQPASQRATDRQDTKRDYSGERRRVLGSPGAFRFRRCLCRVESLLVKVCGRYSLLVTPHLASNIVSSSPVHSRITITIQAH